MSRSAAIIGAGPIGLETALAALERGYEVTVFERGEVGDAVRRWGHVRMFSPLGMNVSMRGIELVREIGVKLPDPDSVITGREYVASYLTPLGEAIEDSIRTNVEVIAVGRAGVLKNELIGDGTRAGTPLRLLLGKGHREWNEDFDYVFDCSGTFNQPNHLGDGGMLAAGERNCREYISYGAPDVLGRQRALFKNRRVLVVGAGHSAASVLRDLAADGRGGEVVWSTRRRGFPPIREIPDDPLAERAAVVRHANALAQSRKVNLKPGSSVLAVEMRDSTLLVTLVDEWGEPEQIQVDRIVAAVGFRPDLELARELQTQVCWATEGTYRLAATLLGEDGDASGADCLAVKSFGAETLLHPEPNFFTLGIKSYGRRPDFLIRTGREQVESIFGWLDAREAEESANSAVLNAPEESQL